MGGMGSGRHWYRGAKNSTDDYRSIDVRRWKRDGLFVSILRLAAVTPWWGGRFHPRTH